MDQNGIASNSSLFFLNQRHLGYDKTNGDQYAHASPHVYKTGQETTLKTMSCPNRVHANLIYPLF